MDHPPVGLLDLLREYASVVGMVFLGAIGWVMKTFAHEHIASMRETTAELAKLNARVAGIDATLTALRERQSELAGRVERIEDHERPR